MSTGAASPDRRRLVQVFVWPALIALAAHAWSVTLPFLAEDYNAVFQIHEAFARGDWSPLWAFSADAREGQLITYYRPLINLSMGVDYWLYGTNPVGFHGTNLALFALVCGLVATLATRLTEDRGIGTLTGLLVALSPFATESVSWILGRDGLIPMLLFLLACHCALRQDTRRSRLLTSTFFLLGLLGKEWVVAGAPVLIMLRWSQNGGVGLGIPTRLMAEAIPLGLALGVYLAMRTLALGTLFSGYGELPPTPLDRSFLGDRLDYLLALILPIPSRDLSGWLRLGLGVAIGLLITWRCLVWARTRTGAPIRLALLWIVCSCAVHSPLPHDTYALADSRYFFPALPPVCLLFAVACRGIGRPRHFAILGVTTCIGFSALLVRGATEWHEVGKALPGMREAIERVAATTNAKRIQLIGVPGTDRSARLGLSLHLAFAPPFDAARPQQVEVLTQAHVVHRGLRRATSYQGLLQSDHATNPDVVCLVWDPTARRLLRADATTGPATIEGRLRRDGDDLRLECTDVRVAMLPGAVLPTPDQVVRLRGTLTAGDPPTLRVADIAPAELEVDLLPPADGRNARLRIHHRPFASFAVFAWTLRTTVYRPTFGVAFTGAPRADFSGYLDENGAVTIDLGPQPPTKGYLQVVTFDPHGRVVFSRCHCAR